LVFGDAGLTAPAPLHRKGCVRLFVFVWLFDNRRLRGFVRLIVILLFLIIIILWVAIQITCSREYGGVCRSSFQQLC
jgi:hypothetical protein